MKEIKKKGNFEECLQTADDLYGIKQYNILDLTPKKIAQLYDSVCNRYKLSIKQSLSQIINRSRKQLGRILVKNIRLAVGL